MKSNELLLKIHNQCAKTQGAIEASYPELGSEELLKEVAVLQALLTNYLAGCREN